MWRSRITIKMEDSVQRWVTKWVYGQCIPLQSGPKDEDFKTAQRWLTISRIQSTRQQEFLGHDLKVTPEGQTEEGPPRRRPPYTVHRVVGFSRRHLTHIGTYQGHGVGKYVSDTLIILIVRPRQ